MACIYQDAKLQLTRPTQYFFIASPSSALFSFFLFFIFAPTLSSRTSARRGTEWKILAKSYEIFRHFVSMIVRNYHVSLYPSVFLFHLRVTYKKRTTDVPYLTTLSRYPRNTNEKISSILISSVRSEFRLGYCRTIGHLLFKNIESKREKVRQIL